MNLHFARQVNYAGNDAGITLRVILRVGLKNVAVIASLDTGASNCIFERAHGEVIGLDIESGEPMIFHTAMGRVETYGHVVSVDTLGIRFESMVYFIANPGIRKNLLGRSGWLDRIRLGVVDYDREIYIAPYDFES